MKAKRDFRDKYDKNRERKAGEEWLFKGPGVYLPQVEIQVLSTVKSVLVKPNQALKVKAADDCLDHQGRQRKVCYFFGASFFSACFILLFSFPCSYLFVSSGFLVRSFFHFL